jgi:hypothetical protein
MIALSSQLRANDINHLISAVPKYPISVKSLISIASRKKLSKEVINFYRVFPDTVVFDNADDIAARTEQIEILRNEQQPLEDNVRGAED